MSDSNTDYYICPVCGGIIEAGCVSMCTCIDEDDWALYDDDYYEQVHHRDDEEEH